MKFRMWLESMGNRVSADEIMEMVRKLHWNPNDFVEGDIIDRIYKYPFYELRALPLSGIDVDEWESDDAAVQEYQEEFKRTKTYPPIVYDLRDKSIIDGTHRAKALKLLGVPTIQAYVGVRK